MISATALCPNCGGAACSAAITRASHYARIWACRGRPIGSLPIDGECVGTAHEKPAPRRGAGELCSRFLVFSWRGLLAVLVLLLLTTVAVLLRPLPVLILVSA